MAKTVYYSKKFKRDAKNQVMELVTPAWGEVLHCLRNELPLPEKYRDHELTGDLKNYRDCHVKPDLWI